MKILSAIAAIILVAFCLSFSLRRSQAYADLYSSSLTEFETELRTLATTISEGDPANADSRRKIKKSIKESRLKLKSLDFWLRYFEPVMYRRINGPLPVEWENEVFEKFEPPYRREGAGLTLAGQYLDEEVVDRDSLGALVNASISALETFRADSITQNLGTRDHFFLANRLYLLNLAALYTTGFECPDTANIIPEIKSMTHAVRRIYDTYEQSFPDGRLSKEYLELYDRMCRFVASQPPAYLEFDHFLFIRDYVNPLFRLNQQFITEYSVVTKNYNDYSLNNDCQSIFDKSLYAPQNTKGIYSLIEDEKLLQEVKKMGKLLFYDPVLSANNLRSCASCHKPTEYFTDTVQNTAFRFDHKERLERNTPSLINSVYNHLVMLDGKHISLQDQARDVMHNEAEMNIDEKSMLQKVLSCKEYKDAFKKFLKHTPEEKEITLSHIVSAITYYYADFSQYNAPFDEAMNNRLIPTPEVKRGFNLFMGKAQCGTCHFVPMFNGVKPPYIGSEFEVIGVPADSGYTKLSADRGRYNVNPATETMNAFRTGTVRNAAFTKPYMHNGVFHTLDQVIDLYDAGGGVGKKLAIANQTLSSDSLRLTTSEKKDLVAFIHSLNENINFDSPPSSLPKSTDKKLNTRKVGGDY